MDLKYSHILKAIFISCILLLIGSRNGIASNWPKSESIQKVSIRVHLPEELWVDSAWLSFAKNIIHPDIVLNSSVVSSNIKNGYYSFELNNIENPIYVSFYFDFLANKAPKHLFAGYLAEPGDDIDVYVEKDTQYLMTRILNVGYYLPIYKYHNYRLLFSGKGACKYSCKYDIDRQIAQDLTPINVIDSTGELLENHSDVSSTIADSILNRYKHQMSDLAYEMLKVDFFSVLELERLHWLSVLESWRIKEKKYLIDRVASNFSKKIGERERLFDTLAKAKSAYYSRLVVEKALIGKSIYNLTVAEIASIMLQLRKSYFGELKDKVISVFSFKLSRTKHIDLVLQMALKEVQTSYCYNEIISFINRNAVGRPAFTFDLPDVNGRIVSLKDFRGKVVFLDFWFKGCKGCVQYYKEVVSKVESEFIHNDKVVFISINVDVEREKWIEAINSGLYTSSNAINLNTGYAGKDHPIIRHFSVYAYPRPILIDQEGNIYCNNETELRISGKESLKNLIIRALSRHLTRK